MYAIYDKDDETWHIGGGMWAHDVAKAESFETHEIAGDYAADNLDSEGILNLRVVRIA